MLLTPPTSGLLLSGHSLRPEDSPHNSPGVVDMCGVDLDVAGARLQELGGWLSAEERDRAARFRFARDRHRYVACRGTLREILSRYTGVAPEALLFSYGSHGKPYLRRTAAAGHVFFNVAHSDGYGLIAISDAAEVGVDLEVVRDVSDAPALARRCFSEAEREALEALPSEQRNLAFFLCWTRKEAFVKSTGLGLSYPLTAFDVGIMPGAAVIHRAPDAAATWSIQDVSSLPAYAAAVVVQAARATIRHAG